MPEMITGGAGFGAFRLNGQVVHYQGLRDSYSVVLAKYQDAFSLRDAFEGNSLVVHYFDRVSVGDGLAESAIQAEAVEVLSLESSEEGQYAYADTITIADASSHS